MEQLGFLKKIFLLIKKIIIYSLLLISISFIYGLSSCGEKIEEFDGFIKPELIQLLTSGTDKNWVRQEKTINGNLIKGNCADSLTIKFIPVKNKVDTTGYLFINPTTESCSLSDFCDMNPEMCQADALFCAKNSDICDELEDNFIFGGSWFIPNPIVTNGVVHTLKISNSEVSINYTINFITSIYLELSATNDGDQLLEKYKAE